MASQMTCDLATVVARGDDGARQIPTKMSAYDRVSLCHDGDAKITQNA